MSMATEISTMGKYTAYILGVLFFIVTLQISYGQTFRTFDPEKITREKEINFFKSTKRGIETKAKIIYYVEEDLQTLSAYQNGLLLWKTNIIEKLGKPGIGEPEIRYIKLDKHKIDVTFGKHTYATVDIITGNAIWEGED